MGNSPSRQSGTPQHQKSSPAPKPAQTNTPEDSKTHPNKPTPKLEPCDVVISATPGDNVLVELLKNKIISAGYTVHSNTSTNDDEARTLGRMLVDAKLLVFVMSEESVCNDKCGDQVSLAYISNKPILLAARKKKAELLPSVSFGLKLTLSNLSWTVFETDTPDDSVVNDFVQSVQVYQNPINETFEAVIEQPLEGLPSAPKNQRMRLNTKLRSATQTTMDAPETEVLDTFWEKNFDDKESIPWYQFQQAFLTNYDANLKGLFPEDQIPWLLDMLQNDIFGGAKDISRDHFFQVRGEAKDKNMFWRVVSQIAIEKFNMQEVFNMQSTVRLTAVENLAKFNNPAVVEALLRLLNDEDANVRAVAAISLGRTGVKEEAIIDLLISKLSDGDRIVRQSVCLSLGALKAKKAIPHISNLWRNDFISVVRDAARTALQKMEVPEAEEVLQVTRILEEEIKHLEGNISIV